MGYKKLLFVCWLIFLFSSAYSQKLFIAENGATEIRRSNVDGTSLELMSGSSIVNTLRSMVFDEQRNTVFWIESNTIIKKGTLTVVGGNTRLISFPTNFASVTGANFQSLVINPLTRELLASSNGGIYKLNIDAVGTITVLPTATIAPFNITTFDIDLVNGKIYFIRPITTTEIWIANLNGTSPVQIVADSKANDIAVDPMGGKIYHTTNIFFPITEGQVVSRDLTTGANPVSIVTGQPVGLRGIAIDHNNGFIFWADGTSAIGRSSLSGTGKIDIVTGLNAPVDVALDFSSSLPPKLYWTEPNVNEVHRINTNGSDYERYHFNSFSTPNGIAIDQNTRIAYWTDETQANIIKGTINETTFSALDTLVDYPNAANGIGGIALDPSNHMMYFAYTAGNRIQRTDFNLPTPFGPIPPASIQDLATINNPFGVAVDLVRRKLYYTSNSLGPTNTGTLSRSNLDGTSPEVLITQSIPSPQRFMRDVKVDAKNGFVYWAFTESNGLATIYKANITNVAGTVTPLITNTSGEIRGIEIDRVTDKLWWASRGIVGLFPPTIKEAKLSDGTGVNTLHTIAFTPPRANFIALDRGCEQPIAATISLTAPLGQTVVTDPKALSTFYVSDVISVNLIVPPGKGSAVVASDGKISYTPNSGTVGTDIITYQICNQCGLCDLASININIPNLPPVIAPVPPGSQILQGETVVTPLVGLISDPNNNLDITTLTVSSPPASGAVASFNSNNELVVDYTGLNFLGPENITIQVCDLAGACSGSIISIMQNCKQPAATAVNLNAPLGQTAIADPISVSTFRTGDVIQIIITQMPTKGTATVQANKTIAFTPNASTVGTDVIMYQICNQCGLCDTESINITIPNLPPVIAPPSTTIQATEGGSITIPVVSLLSDPNNNLDLSTLSVTLAPSSGASASFNSNNELVINYTGISFSGTDNITIQVCDLAGACSSVVVNVAVSAAPPPPPPPTSPGDIVAYNGMSPNGDLLNAYFRIENIETVEPQNKVSIYNRWGDKVFEVDNYDNNDPTKRFNGESDKGKDLPSGVYFYKIEFGSGSPGLEGYLTLKR
ncbi:MAG: Ig-like domain-containing protein [Cyclobacteriaceae bacterium]